MNLSDRPSEISFETDAFACIKDHREMQIVSTEQACTPQLDLSSDGVTLRLRAHEGLLFVAKSEYFGRANQLLIDSLHLLNDMAP